MEGVDGEDVDEVAEPVGVGADVGGGAEAEGEGEAELVLGLARGDAELHDGFGDQIGVGQGGGVLNLQEHRGFLAGVAYETGGQDARVTMGAERDGYVRKYAFCRAR